MSALHIHMEPVMYVARGYADPDGYAKRHAYELVVSVFVLGNGKARVFATHGDLDRATLGRLARALGDLGVHTVLVDRHGVEQEWKLSRAAGRSKAGA